MRDQYRDSLFKCTKKNEILISRIFIKLIGVSWKSTLLLTTLNPYQHETQHYLILTVSDAIHR